MANICINCGKRIGHFDEALEFKDGSQICYKCKEPIQKMMNDLYIATSFVDKDTARKSIMEYGNENFNKRTVESLKYTLDSVCGYESVEELEESQRIFIELEKERENLKRNQMVTTGYNFEGYKIIKYLEVISGEVVLGTGFLSEFSASLADFLGTGSEMFANKLDLAKKIAKDKLISKSAMLGGNAIIGVDFDYITFSNNMIGVIANGTSVIVEKIID